MTWLLKASHSRCGFTLEILYILPDGLYLLTCLVPADYMWTCCVYILVIISVPRSVNVSPLVRVPSVCVTSPGVNMCALSLLVKVSHATIIWIPFGSTRCILECYLSLMPTLSPHPQHPTPESPPQFPQTHLTFRPPYDFFTFALRCNV